MKFDDLKVLLEKEDIKVQLSEETDREKYTTLDIMRNYLNDDDMENCLRLLVHDKKFLSISQNLILTANNLQNPV